MKSLRFPSTRLLACLALSGATLLHADTNRALEELLSTLARNGTLTREQSASILQLAGENKPGPSRETTAAAPTVAPAAAMPKVVALPKQKEVTRLIVAGKLHPQWETFSTRVSNGPSLADRNTFSLRRIELELTGDIAPDWSGTFTADFAASNTLNQAFVTYKGIPQHELRIGQTKVPFLMEESISDSVLKGVERSASHRAVVEQTGRGIGSKLAGLHLKSSAATGPYYAVAVTNAGAKNGSGYAGNVSNGLAYWGRVGTNLAAGDGRIDLGADAACQPDYLPGGRVSAFAGHVHYLGKQFDVLAEIVTASYPRPGLPNARLVGYMIEPVFRFAKKWEAVVRFSSVDSDGIGVSPGSLIRNAPATGNFDRLDSYYLGGNYYIVGNAVRLAFGYDHAKATGRITGTAEENTIDGLSTRFQFLF